MDFLSKASTIDCYYPHIRRVFFSFLKVHTAWIFYVKRKERKVQCRVKMNKACEFLLKKFSINIFISPSLRNIVEINFVLLENLCVWHTRRRTLSLIPSMFIPFIIFLSLIELKVMFASDKLLSSFRYSPRLPLKHSLSLFRVRIYLWTNKNINLNRAFLFRSLCS